LKYPHVACERVNYLFELVHLGGFSVQTRRHATSSDNFASTPALLRLPRQTFSLGICRFKE
jgi:hypothetical protein